MFTNVKFQIVSAILSMMAAPVWSQQSIKCDARLQKVIFEEDFGKFDRETARAQSAQCPYNYRSECTPIKYGGTYAVVATPKWGGCGEQEDWHNSCDCGGTFWYKDIYDHTQGGWQSGQLGGMLQVNCRGVDGDRDVVYERQVTVCKQTYLNFSAWVNSANSRYKPDGTSDPMQAKFVLRKGGPDGEKIDEYRVDDIPIYGTWTEISAMFNTADYETVTIQLVNLKPWGQWGNDILLDDIKITACAPEANLQIEDPASGAVIPKTEVDLLCPFEDDTHYSSVRLRGVVNTEAFTNPYFYWQIYDESLAAWEIDPLAEGFGLDTYTVDAAHTGRYRVIVGNNAETARHAAQHDDMGPCGLYSITNDVTIGCKDIMMSSVGRSSICKGEQAEYTIDLNNPLDVTFNNVEVTISFSDEGDFSIENITSESAITHTITGRTAKVMFRELPASGSVKFQCGVLAHSYSNTQKNVMRAYVSRVGDAVAASYSKAPERSRSEGQTSVNGATVYDVVTEGGAVGYCADAEGVKIKLSGSEIGVVYTLMSGETRIERVAGTGAAIAFATVVRKGSYKVYAEIGMCLVEMNGELNIVEYQVPDMRVEVGNNTKCADFDGAYTITAFGGESPYTYSIDDGANYTNDASAAGFQTLEINAKVKDAKGCVSLTKRAVISDVHVSPKTYNLYSLKGETEYCVNSDGVELLLSGSDTGVSYSLKNKDTGALISEKNGKGGVISFGKVKAGKYYAEAYSGETKCVTVMKGEIEIKENSLPYATMELTGSQHFCTGNTSELTFNVNGGTMPYDIQYLEGTTEQSLLDVPASQLPMRVEIRPTATLTYKLVSVTDSKGCSSNPSPAIETEVQVDGKPTGSAGGSFTQCNNAEFTLAGSLGWGTGTWSSEDPNVTFLDVHNPKTKVRIGDNSRFATVPLKWTISNGVCPDNVSSTTVTNNDCTDLSVKVNTDHDVCSGGDVKYAISVYNGNANEATGVVLRYVAGDGEEQIVNIGVLPSKQTANFDGVIHTSATMSNKNVSASVRKDGGDWVDAMDSFDVHPLPMRQNLVSTAREYCQGGSVRIGLESSESNAHYILFKDGASVELLAGTGGKVWFSKEYGKGVYTLQAYYPATMCNIVMETPLTIVENPLPQLTVVTNNNTMCEEYNGSYMIMPEQGLSPYSYSVNGGADYTALQGMDHIKGDMLIAARVKDSNGCESDIKYDAIYNMAVTPVVYKLMSDSLEYCNYGATSGVVLKLSGSQIGFSYDLYKGDVVVETKVGTGEELNFGAQREGSYHVVAFNGVTKCVETMEGTVVIKQNELPEFTVDKADNTRCVPRYDGYVNIVVKSGSGTAPYSFSINDGVSYSGRALYDNQEEFDAVIRVKDSKGCVAGPVAAKVSNKSVPLTKFDLVSDGGKKQYCANADGVELILTGSEQGTEYTLYKNGAATVPVQSGTGGALNFGIQKAGTYTVKALNPVTGCEAVMNHDVELIEHVAPSAEISGAVTICKGSPTDLTFNVQGADGAFQVYYSDGVSEKSTSSESVTVTPAQTTLYSVTKVINNWGCVTEYEEPYQPAQLAKVTVDNHPYSDAGPDQVKYNESTFTMDASVPAPGEVGEWRIISVTPAGVTPVIADVNNPKTVITGVVTGSNVNLEWVVSSALGVCSESWSNVAISNTDGTNMGLHASLSKPLICVDDTEEYTLELTNLSDSRKAKNVEVVIGASDSEVSDVTVSVGSYASGVWTIGDIDAHTSVKLKAVVSPTDKLTQRTMSVQAHVSNVNGLSYPTYDSAPKALKEEVSAESYPALIDFELVASSYEVTATQEEVTITAIPTEGSLVLDYTWTKNGTLLDTHDAVISDILFTDSKYEVTATGKCKSITKNVIIKALWPTAIVPDGPGRNGEFARGCKITVFNRFNEKVFEGNDGWDGTLNCALAKKGAKADPGVYYYYMAFPDGTSHKGVIEVVKF